MEGMEWVEGGHSIPFFPSFSTYLIEGASLNCSPDAIASPATCSIIVIITQSMNNKPSRMEYFHLFERDSVHEMSVCIRNDGINCVVEIEWGEEVRERVTTMKVQLMDGAS